METFCACKQLEYVSISENLIIPRTWVWHLGRVWQLYSLTADPDRWTQSLIFHTVSAESFNLFNSDLSF